MNTTNAASVQHVSPLTRSARATGLVLEFRFKPVRAVFVDVTLRDRSEVLLQLHGQGEFQDSGRVNDFEPA